MELIPKVKAEDLITKGLVDNDVEAKIIATMFAGLQSLRSEYERMHKNDSDDLFASMYLINGDYGVYQNRKNHQYACMVKSNFEVWDELETKREIADVLAAVIQEYKLPYTVTNESCNFYMTDGYDHKIWFYRNFAKCTMDDLIEALEQLEGNVPREEMSHDEVCDTYFYYDYQQDDVATMAEMLMINNLGGCNWSNIYKLRNAGYDVYAGDKDSFGWLTGCIEKNDRIVVYG